QATDSPGGVEPRNAGHHHLVQESPAPHLASPTPHAVPEAPWALRLLRHQGQLPPIGGSFRTHQEGLGEVAEPPWRQQALRLEGVRAAGRGAPSTDAQDRPRLDLTTDLQGSNSYAPRLPRPGQPRNRMREFRTYGSVGGPAGNRRPYPAANHHGRLPA